MTPQTAVVNLHAEPDFLEPGPTPAPTRSLAYKLAEVMAQLHRIPKAGRNEFHGYAYATEADIVEAVRIELAQRHVILIPAVLKQTREPVGEKGSILTTLEMQFSFLDGDSGEVLVFPWLGAGTDKEDKGAYKAMTGATKYFLLKTFLLPTGDDPEQDGKPAPASKPKATTPRPAPTAAAKPQAVPTSTGEMFTIAKVYPADAAKRKPWGVVFSDEQKFTTFDDSVGQLAQDFQRRGMPCVRVTEKNAKGYTNLIELHGAMQTGADLEQPEMQDAEEPEWLRDA